MKREEEQYFLDHGFSKEEVEDIKSREQILLQSSLWRKLSQMYLPGKLGIRHHFERGSFGNATVRQAVEQIVSGDIEIRSIGKGGRSKLKKLLEELNGR